MRKQNRNWLFFREIGNGLHSKRSMLELNFGVKTDGMSDHKVQTLINYHFKEFLLFLEKIKNLSAKHSLEYLILKKKPSFRRGAMFERLLDMILAKPDAESAVNKCSYSAPAFSIQYNVNLYYAAVYLDWPELLKKLTKDLSNKEVKQIFWQWNNNVRGENMALVLQYALQSAETFMQVRPIIGDNEIKTIFSSQSAFTKDEMLTLALTVPENFQIFLDIVGISSLEASTIPNLLDTATAYPGSFPIMYNAAITYFPDTELKVFTDTLYKACSTAIEQSYLEGFEKIYRLNEDFFKRIWKIEIRKVKPEGKTSLDHAIRSPELCKRLCSILGEATIKDALKPDQYKRNPFYYAVYSSNSSRIIEEYIDIDSDSDSDSAEIFLTNSKEADKIQMLRAAAQCSSENFPALCKRFGTNIVRAAFFGESVKSTFPEVIAGSSVKIFSTIRRILGKELKDFYLNPLGKPVDYANFRENPITQLVDYAISREDPTIFSDTIHIRELINNPYNTKNSISTIIHSNSPYAVPMMETLISMLKSGIESESQVEKANVCSICMNIFQTYNDLVERSGYLSNSPNDGSFNTLCIDYNLQSLNLLMEFEKYYHEKLLPSVPPFNPF